MSTQAYIHGAADTLRAACALIEEARNTLDEQGVCPATVDILDGYYDSITHHIFLIRSAADYNAGDAALDKAGL